MKRSESIIELSKALASFQGEVKQPMKDALNPYFKSPYVPIENVVDSITEVAPKYGLSFTQWPLNGENGDIGVITLLMHSSGEFIEYDPIYMKPEKNTPQGAGSVITYLKRYSLSAAFGLTSDRDDDASGASEPIEQEQVGLIKVRVLEFARLRNKKKEQVYEVLKMSGESDIENLSKVQADAILKQLDIWIGHAKGELNDDGSQNQSQS